MDFDRLITKLEKIRNETFTDTNTKTSKSNKQFVEKKNSFQSQIKNIIQDIEQLKNKISEQEKKDTNSLKNKLNDIGKDFENKINFVYNLLLSIEKFCQTAVTGGIFGSLARQYIELPFALKNLNNCDFSMGNPIGHDIDIAVFSYKPSENILAKFNDYMLLMTQYIQLSKMFTNMNKIKIGKYNVIDVRETTVKNDNELPLYNKPLVNITKYLLHISDENNKTVKVDLLCWYPACTHKNVIDFDVNSFFLTKVGINCPDYSFFKILNNIQNKQTNLLVNLENYQSIMNYPSQKSDKIKSLINIPTFISQRFKILEYGYDKIISNFNKIPEFKIETSECYITSCEGPYISFALECGHNISIMAYHGCLTKSDSQDSEKFSCPVCRADMKIKFSIADSSFVPIIWSPAINNELSYVDENLEKPTKSQIIFGPETSITDLLPKTTS